MKKLLCIIVSFMLCTAYAAIDVRYSPKEISFGQTIDIMYTIVFEGDYSQVDIEKLKNTQRLDFSMEYTVDQIEVFSNKKSAVVTITLRPLHEGKILFGAGVLTVCNPHNVTDTKEYLLPIIAIECMPYIPYQQKIASLEYPSTIVHMTEDTFKQVQSPEHIQEEESRIYYAMWLRNSTLIVLVSAVLSILLLLLIVQYKHELYAFILKILPKRTRDYKKVIEQIAREQNVSKAWNKYEQIIRELIGHFIKKDCRYASHQELVSILEKENKSIPGLFYKEQLHILEQARFKGSHDRDLLDIQIKKCALLINSKAHSIQDVSK